MLFDGPLPGFARHDAGDWHFDYPASWTFYRPTDPLMGKWMKTGILTSAHVDEDRACRDTKDGQRCIASLMTLQPGDVMIEITRGWAGWLDDPVAQWTRIDPDLGRPVMLAGVPARVSEGAQSGYHRVLWDIVDGPNLSRAVTLEIKVRTPGEDVALQQIAAMMASWTFVPAIQPIDPAAAAAFASRAIRELKTVPGYECFPEAVGVESQMAVGNLAGDGLTQPVEVRCMTSIVPTPIGFWRLQLDASWEAQGGVPAGNMTLIQWLAWDGTVTGGTGEHSTLPYCCT